jgi:hypothetical protein
LSPIKKGRKIPIAAPLGVAGASPDARSKIGASVMEELRAYAEGDGVTYPEEVHLLTAVRQ